MVIMLAQVYICCNNHKATNVEKQVYYKIYSQKDSLIGFSLRKYVFSNDTMIEKSLSINLEGKKMNNSKQTFFKKGKDVYIFSNIKNNRDKYLYFSPSLKDTCLHVDRNIQNFYLCNKGKIDFKKHKNVYEVLYDERGYDSRKETLILDKDYTLLARFEDCYNYRKEIITENMKEIESAKIMLENVSKQLPWW